MSVHLLSVRRAQELTLKEIRIKDFCRTWLRSGRGQPTIANPLEWAYRAGMSRGTFLQSDAFKILVFIAGTIVLGALLAPFLYQGGKFVVARGWLEGGLFDGLNDSMDRARFSRYFNRSILLGGFIMIFPTVKWLNAGK